MAEVKRNLHVCLERANMKKRVLLIAWIALSVMIILSIFDIGFAGDGISRTLLKTGGLIGALLGIVGISIAGFLAGRSYDSYTGWERFTHGAGMFFNRKPFQKDGPTYERAEHHRRVAWVETFEGRLEGLMSLMMPPDGSESNLWQFL